MFSKGDSNYLAIVKKFVQTKLSASGNKFHGDLLSSAIYRYKKSKKIYRHKPLKLTERSWKKRRRNVLLYLKRSSTIQEENLFNYTLCVVTIITMFPMGLF